MSPPVNAQDRILILAPMGRDAHLAASALSDVGLEAALCSTLDAFCRELGNGAAVGLLTEEALAHRPRAQLIDLLRDQPPWSDFPLLVLSGRPPNPAAKRRLALAISELGNVTVLDRPMHPETLVGAVRSAFRARQRQYESRELLHRLEEAVRQRDRFLATLSHELRNPLAAIQLAAQLLGRGLARDASDRYLAIVDRQTKHLARLVDDLLEVSRVTSRKITLQAERLDVREVLQKAIQPVEATVEHHRLTLNVSFSEEPIWVNADPVRLEQIATNLLTNAIKYTPSPGRIDVSAESIGDSAVVRVRDTGVGIDPKMLDSIFEMFVQADRSLDRAKGGMGIGLTLVQSLVQLHGGAIEARSAGENHGSEFIVTLPLDNSLPRPVDSPRHATRQATGQAGRRILLVEDSADNRMTMQELLEDSGCVVTVAADGLEGVQKALAFRPEVALIDIGLPGIDGYEVARQVRAELGSSVILIALTGYGQPEDQLRAEQAGFDVHLTKPVGIPELEAALQA